MEDLKKEVYKELCLQQFEKCEDLHEEYKKHYDVYNVLLKQMEARNNEFEKMEEIKKQLDEECFNLFLQLKTLIDLMKGDK